MRRRSNSYRGESWTLVRQFATSITTKCSSRSRSHHLARKRGKTWTSQYVHHITFYHFIHAIYLPCLRHPAPYLGVLQIEDEHDPRKRSWAISNSDASVSPKSPPQKVRSMLYFHAVSNTKTLFHSVTNEVNPTADIAVPMPGHMSHLISRNLTTYTKNTKPLLQRLRGTMLMLVTLCVTRSTSTSWFLTSGMIAQTSRYVPDLALPPLYHLPPFTCLRNCPASLSILAKFVLID